VLLAIPLFFYSEGYVLELMAIQYRLDRAESAKIILWFVEMPG
jgi:hypothetical protein